MAVTLQQIAEKAGVSRGTVDRALNNRGRIRPEVAEKIRKIAQEMGYRPNRAGESAGSYQPLFSNRRDSAGDRDAFYRRRCSVESRRRRKKWEHLGGEVILKEIRGINTKAVLAALEELRSDNVQAIAINPAQNQTTKELIGKYMNEYEIPVVTFNTDIEDSGRLCYVGQNAYQCGRAAAGLMGGNPGGGKASWRRFPDTKQIPV